MPNNVRNAIKMQGISALPLFSEEDGKKALDFNKIIPMPDDLDVKSGSITDQAIIYYLTNEYSIPVNCLDVYTLELLKKSIGNMFSVYMLDDLFLKTMEKSHKMASWEKEKLYKAGEHYVNNYIKYGHTTWYTWRLEKWGTKWNAYSFEQKDENTITFDTAWSNPEPVMIRLSEMYPDTNIEHWWADENRGYNTGHRLYLNGKIFSSYNVPDASNEAYEIFASLHGAKCLYKDGTVTRNRENVNFATDAN